MSTQAAAVKNPLMEAFGAAVTGQINDNREHGWGSKDSLAVIEAVIAEDATIEIARLLAAAKEPGSYCPSEAALALIALVVNPSAFRQRLEGEKRPDGQTVLAKPEKAKREKMVLSLYS